MPKTRESISGKPLMEGLARHDEVMERWRQDLERSISDRLLQAPQTTTTTVATSTTTAVPSTPAQAPAGVSSVNGETGAVSLRSDDIPEGILNFYFTEARFVDLFNKYSVPPVTPITAVGGVLVGQLALGSGVDSGSVTGLGLGFIPAQVQVSVTRPAGGLSLYAVVISGSVTADGFDFELSGATDGIDYVLNYVLNPPTLGVYSGSVAISNGVDNGSVTGLALPFAPTRVVSLSVSRPAGGLNLIANANEGTITDDGFNFELSGTTDSTDYVLNFTLTI